MLNLYRLLAARSNEDVEPFMPQHGLENRRLIRLVLDEKNATGTRMVPHHRPMCAVHRPPRLHWSARSQNVPLPCVAIAHREVS